MSILVERCLDYKVGALPIVAVVLTIVIDQEEIVDRGIERASSKVCV